MNIPLDSTGQERHHRNGHESRKGTSMPHVRNPVDARLIHIPRLWRRTGRLRRGSLALTAIVALSLPRLRLRLPQPLSTQLRHRHEERARQRLLDGQDLVEVRVRGEEGGVGDVGGRGNVFFEGVLSGGVPLVDGGGRAGVVCGVFHRHVVRVGAERVVVERARRGIRSFIFAVVWFWLGLLRSGGRVELGGGMQRSLE